MNRAARSVVVEGWFIARQFVPVQSVVATELNNRRAKKEAQLLNERYARLRPEVDLVSLRAYVA